MATLPTVKKKRGRGRPSVGTTRILVHMPAAELSDLDQWIARQKDGPGRPEAIRRLVKQGTAASPPIRRRSPKAASEARDLAGKQIDKLSDPSATDEERQTRKRRLLKGPKEFQDILSRSKS